MSGSLTAILKLREIRELSAIAQVNKRHAQLDVCVQRQQQQKQYRENYRNWRVGQEAALFKALQSDPVNSTKLSCFRAKLTALREREASLTADLDEAEQRLSAARAAFDEAQRLRLQRTKAKEKLVAYLTIKGYTASSHEQHREEQVLEEFHASTYFLKKL